MDRRTIKLKGGGFMLNWILLDIIVGTMGIAAESESSDTPESVLSSLCMYLTPILNIYILIENIKEWHSN